MVGVMAKPTITKSCSHDKVVTENKPCNAGINKIQDKNRTPMINAPIVYRFEKRPIRYKECLLRQLKP